MTTLIQERAEAWARGLDTGLSSKAIMAHMLGMPPAFVLGMFGPTDACYPRDPADLGRCLLLLERIPEWKPRIREMRRYGPYWSALVERWDDISVAMIDEVGIDWSKGRSAEKTYGLMQDILKTAREATV